MSSRDCCSRLNASSSSIRRLRSSTYQARFTLWRSMISSNSALERKMLSALLSGIRLSIGGWSWSGIVFLRRGEQFSGDWRFNEICDARQACEHANTKSTIFANVPRSAANNLPFIPHTEEYPETTQSLPAVAFTASESGQRIIPTRHNVMLLAVGYDFSPDNCSMFHCVTSLPSCALPATLTPFTISSYAGDCNIWDFRYRSPL